jgi:hypothetical protein
LAWPGGRLRIDLKPMISAFVVGAVAVLLCGSIFSVYIKGLLQSIITLVVVIQNGLKFFLFELSSTELVITSRRVGNRLGYGLVLRRAQISHQLGVALHDGGLVFTAGGLLVRHEEVEAQLGGFNVLLVIIAVSGGQRHFPSAFGLIHFLGALNLRCGTLAGRWEKGGVNGFAGVLIFLRTKGTWNVSGRLWGHLLSNVG